LQQVPNHASFIKIDKERIITSTGVKLKEVPSILVVVV
jgi:pyruvate/2-oxoglutarate dehydrogenase complex dihydrolipoamide dehydrogenase (E3) component